MDVLLHAIENHVAVLTLNCPDKANALVPEMKTRLAALLRELHTDPEVRSVLLCANGRNFCAGGDLSSMREASSCVDGRERMKGASVWLRELYQIEKPVVAAVQGCAYGAGFSMALACDFIVAADTARFCCSFLNVGLVPDMGLLYLLPRRIGMGRAKELAFSRRVVAAPEAYSLGIVDRMTAPEGLREEAMKLAQSLANGPTYAIGMTKKLCNRSFEMDFAGYMDAEADMQAIAFQTYDHRVSVKAFFEKATPVLHGR